MQPVHKMFSMFVYWPLVSVFKKSGPFFFEFLQKFYGRNRKSLRTAFVVRFHKNRESCARFVEFFLNVSFFHYSLILPQFAVSCNRDTIFVMKEKAFFEQYKNLNSQQREAVDAIEGPVMVVAGPGTGKTQVLTLRIANILDKTDTEPESILALTFTESAAASMKRRLAEIIGSPAYSVAINTFHGFCNDVIKTYPEYFPRIMNSINITEVDQINIIKEFSEFRVKDTLKKINDFKKDGLSPKEVEKIYPHTKKFGVRTAKIYAKYETELKKQKLYDFSDMILEVLRTLKKNKNLLQILKERY